MPTLFHKLSLPCPFFQLKWGIINFLFSYLCSPSVPFSTVNLWSLASGEQVHSIAFKSEVYDVLSNQRYEMVGLQNTAAANRKSLLRYWSKKNAIIQYYADHDLVTFCRLIVVALQEKIAAFDACTFKNCFCITSEFLRQSWVVIVVVLWNGRVSQMQLMWIKSLATFLFN